MDKKVLIFMESHYLKPIGGPAGYLYNLKTELDRRKINNVSFIEVENSKRSTYKKVFEKLPKRLKTQYHINKRRKERRFLLSDSQKLTNINLNNYDIVHFHSTFKLYSIKDSLKNFKGKVILTSHAPKPSYLEYMDKASSEELKRYKEEFESLSKIEKYAFERADYIFFPCSEAEEPYINNWDEYLDIKERSREKYRYLLSGIKPCEVKNKDIRKHYDIPNDALLISYVGRHNETKGYDKLKIIGEKLLTENGNIYFIVAGKEEPLAGLQHERWIEVGWTSDPHSIIGASDIFVLPNKETYFDLVMLEVLSLGKLVVASNTGGNKFFNKDDIEGIFLYNDIDEAVKKIKNIMKMTNEDRNNKEQANKRLYQTYFNNEVFCENYLSLLKSLD
ncbi:glycosyltransferase family 4 protein [Rossellomorea vietnamensis]|uniref:Glycosyltransferase family 4 protein n=1 Tax=Rossellomorea vietnamensis TaxID=218284 RepID=A0A5D4M2Z2_9BACI|nr:glycosyltransferase family 4 protein [Rossellomorea vietnamensis]TYR95911.1 glycosyltransferase family 4 protein [Rossellomorea vietnamensis]